jgi:hypothetical protein
MTPLARRANCTSVLENVGQDGTVKLIVAAATQVSRRVRRNGAIMSWLRRAMGAIFIGLRIFLAAAKVQLRRR